ncbi:hypothetical protein SteCoe_10763 [Stentor coeruleus]|uniref:Uncharacterized protein n=1 Tax=Stentor coeruleus TaxID=5963 RepID=A0A1R2CER9_9CILI|nr:hypothetical protein SteCoe_10763 [Stentor coeruleus]
MSVKALKNRKSEFPINRSSRLNSSLSIYISPLKAPKNLPSQKIVSKPLSMHVKVKHQSLLIPPSISLDSSIISNKSSYLPKIDDKDKSKNNHSPEYFKKKIDKLLEKTPNDNSNAENQLQIFIEIYNEIALILEPYTGFLGYLKDNIVKLAKNNDSGNQKFLEDIEKLKREKIALLKRLNFVNEDFERLKKENDLINKKLQYMGKYNSVDYEELVESSLKKTEILEKQKMKIEELTVNLIILKKTLDKLKSNGVDIYKAIGEVDAEMSKPYYIG